MNLAPFTSTRCARRDARKVFGGTSDLASRKVAAHRAERRVNRAALAACGVDYEYTPRRVTGRDVS